MMDTLMNKRKISLWLMLLYALLTVLFLAGSVVFGFWYWLQYRNGASFFSAAKIIDSGAYRAP